MAKEIRCTQDRIDVWLDTTGPLSIIANLEILIDSGKVSHGNIIDAMSMSYMDGMTAGIERTLGLYAKERESTTKYKEYLQLPLFI